MWKSLKGIVENGDNYEVSTDGKIWSITSDRILRGSLDNYGYYRVQLFLNGLGKSYRIHRLVGLTFIPKIEGKPFINHRDGQKTNNSIDNLEWVTNQENIIHAYDTGLRDREKSREFMRKLGKEYGYLRGLARRKKVAQYNSNGELIAIYESAADASRKTGIPSNTISCQCLGNKSSRDTYFKYAQ